MNSLALELSRIDPRFRRTGALEWRTDYSTDNAMVGISYGQIEGIWYVASWEVKEKFRKRLLSLRLMTQGEIANLERASAREQTNERG